MTLPLELSLEQQFNLQLYKEQVKELKPEEAQTFILELLRQLMIKDNMVKYYLQKDLLESRNAI